MQTTGTAGGYDFATKIILFHFNCNDIYLYVYIWMKTPNKTQQNNWEEMEMKENMINKLQALENDVEFMAKAKAAAITTVLVKVLAE